MRTTTIDALKGRDGAGMDIPRAYLSVEMADKVHVFFRGTLTELMVAVDPAL